MYSTSNYCVISSSFGQTDHLTKRLPFPTPPSLAFNILHEKTLDISLTGFIQLTAKAKQAQFDEINWQKCFGPYKTRTYLTVRFLVSGAGTGSSELLGLATSGIGNQECAVILDQDVLDGFLALFVNICKFLVKKIFKLSHVKQTKWVQWGSELPTFEI